MSMKVYYGKVYYHREGEDALKLDKVFQGRDFGASVLESLVSVDVYKGYQARAQT